MRQIFYLIISTCLHLGVLAVILISPQPQVKPTVVAKLAEPILPTKPIIKAGLVDQKQVQQALKRQQLVEKKRQAKLKQQRVQAKKLQAEATKAKQQMAKVLKAKQQALKEKQRLEKMNQAAKEQKKKLVAEAGKLNNELRQIKAKKREQHRLWLDREFNRYIAEYTQAIETNRILSAVFADDIYCRIRIKLLADGSIASLKLVKSSGYPAYDTMAENAIYKTAPFPMPSDPVLREKLKDIELGFKNG